MKKFLVIVVYSVLTLSTLLVFRQVRNFNFVNYDDNLYVYKNQHVLNGLTPDGVIWAFTTGHAANWHPVTWLSLMLDCQLFGTNPSWMHFINLLFHLANTLLLFAVLRKMTGSLWPSAFVAAAFALHPMHVESVAWIAERKDVLSTLFWLLTMLAYLAYVRHPCICRYALTLVLFVLGLMTKPMLVTLPFVLLLLDYWPLDRFAAPQTVKTTVIPDRQGVLYRIIIEKVPFLAIAAISSVITFLVQRSGGAMVDFNALPLKLKFANAVISYAKYMGKMFWPQNLAVFYPYSTIAIRFWQVVLYTLLIIVVSIFVIRFGRKQRYLPVGWFWFVGTLIPVIGLVQVGEQSMADRYTYITYIGLFIMLAWGLPQLLSKWPQRKFALGAAAAIVLTAIGTGSYRQAGHWKNSFTLFTHAIEVTQNNYIAHYSLGAAYGELGRHQDEIEEYNQAIRFKSDYAEAHNNLGDAYSKLGCWKEAIDAYIQAIRIKPDFADAHYNLGNAYNDLGRHQEAIEAYKQAIRINPDDADAHYNLGIAYGKLGRWQDAIEAFKQAIRIKLDYSEAYNNLGATYCNLGRWQDAIEAYKQAIRINPGNADAHYNLGVTYIHRSVLGTGDKGSALEEYKILKTLDAEQANKLFNLIDK